MIVIENIDAAVIVVAFAADSGITRAQVATLDVLGQPCLSFPGFAKRLALPRAILTMGCDDDPLFAQRMPSFLPLVFASVHRTSFSSPSQRTVPRSGTVTAPRSFVNASRIRYVPIPATRTGCSTRRRALVQKTFAGAHRTR